MVGEMNYGSSIPLEQVLNIQKTIEIFRAKYKDGYVGRSLIDQRPGVARTVRKDIVRKIDKSAANDGISTARISMGGTSPDIVGSKGKDILHSIYRIDAAIQRNEAELSLDPNLWSRDTSIAMLECLRRENYTIINGDTATGIVGLVGAATANSRGSITSGTNAGAWDGSETDKVMDPYDDLRRELALARPPLSDLRGFGLLIDISVRAFVNTDVLVAMAFAANERETAPLVQPGKSLHEVDLRDRRGGSRPPHDRPFLGRIEPQ